MKKLFALFALAIAVALASISTPAVAMGQTQQIVKSNQPVPTADQEIAKAFNKCVSDRYSAMSNRSAETNNAMGKYRDTYTLVTRSITAKNLPEFQKHMRTAQIEAAEVGTSCVFDAPAAS